MSINDASAAVRARADSLWPGMEPTVSLAYRNENFTRAYDANGTPTPWVLIEVIWNGGEFVSIGAPGSNRARRQGHIWVHAFVPVGSGDDRASELAAEAAGMFEGQDFSGVVCEAMMPGGYADDEDGVYYGQSASVPFYYDETA